MLTLALLTASLAGGEPALEQGRELYRGLKYEEALGKLEQAAEAPGLSTADRREAFDLLARTWAALGNLPRAQAVYGQLIARDPNAPAPEDAAPKIREAFRAAKTALFPPGTVRLTRRAGGEGVLRVELFDPWGQVAKLELHELGGAVHPLGVQPLTEFKLGAGVTGVWVEAHDASDAKVAGLGSRAKPVRVGRIAPRPEVPARASPAALLDEGRDDEALSSIDVARTGAVDRSGALGLWEVEACAAARLGDAERAVRAYREAFALQPALPPPDRCEEGWTAWFAARDAAQREPRRYHPLPLEFDGKLTRATVTRDDEASALARGCRFHFRRQGGWTEKDGEFNADRAQVEVEGRVLGWWIEVLGAGVSLGSANAPLAPGLDAPLKEPAARLEPTSGVTRSGSGRLPAVIAVGGVAVVAGGVGAALGVLALQDAAAVRSPPPGISQRASFDDAARQRREAVAANVLFGVAAAAAISAVIVFFAAPGD